MKKIIIIGSSGGNLFNLGGAEPDKLLNEIYVQTESAGIDISGVQFIAASESMDKAKPTTKASLYSLKNQRRPEPILNGELQQINKEAQIIDKQLSEAIYDENVDGVIIMSGDVDGSNQLVVNAAVEKKLPIVGTGGTAMALLAAKGANIIATSGTTGTTNRTRAITFITSLAKYWNIKYKPILGTSENNQESNKPLIKRINIRSIMIPALPGFIAMAIVLALSRIPGMESLESIFNLLLGGLPIIVAAIAAKQISELDEVSIVAGVVAGVLSVEGGLIGGIIGGIGAGILVRYIFNLCLTLKFPMTTINIAAGGISGLLSGLIMYYFLSPLALIAGDYIKLLIEYTLDYSPLLAGLIAGVIIWPAILGGVYHAVILPLVLLEMEKTGFSFLGAVDMVSLVMVAAGINLANVVAPRNRSEATVAAPGLLINLGFGTFVESAYPFMFSNKIVFLGALFSSAIGGAALGLFNVKGVAYVPSFASPFISNNPYAMATIMLGVLILSCLITVVANRFNPLTKKK